MADSEEGSQHVFERLRAAGMIQGVTLRCVMTVIRDLQHGQDGGVLTDPAVVNLSGQPLTDGFTARCPAMRRTCWAQASREGSRTR